MEQIDLKQLAELKMHIKKIKANHEVEIKKLISEYELKVKETTEIHKDRLAKSGELYDIKNNITLKPVYADREIDGSKLYVEHPDKYWGCAHLPSAYIVETARESIEDDMKCNEQESYRKLAGITIKDAKSVLSARELEDYWMPRKIVKYDLDLKIK